MFEFLTVGKSTFITEVVLLAHSVLENGLIPGGHGGDKGRQTVFFTPLNSFGWDADEEEPCDDYTTPQKVHYKSHWKRNQDAVYWIKFPEQKNKDCNSGRRSHTQSLYTVLCQQIASTELLLKTEIEYCSKDSRLHDLRQKSQQKQLALAAAAVDSRRRDLHKETCAQQDGDEGCQRQHNR